MTCIVFFMYNWGLVDYLTSTRGMVGVAYILNLGVLLLYSMWLIEHLQ